MITYAKKLLLMSTLTLGLIGGSLQMANAAPDADIDVSAVTRNAIVVTKQTDMDFGQLDVGISTQAGDVVLTTAGAIDVTGATDVTATGGTPTAGQVTVETDAATDITVTCTDGVLDNGAGDQLDITELHVLPTAGSADPDQACDGAGASITPTAQDVVLAVGGTINLDGANKVVTGNQTYATGTGGTAPNISAVYQ